MIDHVNSRSRQSGPFGSNGGLSQFNNASSPSSPAHNPAATGASETSVLDTTTLRRTAAVVRYRRHVGDRGDLDAKTMQRAHRGLTARARALDPHFEVLHAVFHRHAASRFSCHLGCKRGRFTRTLEALTTRRCPGKCIALTIGDRDDGVVERRVNVNHALGAVLLDFLEHAVRPGVVRSLSHYVFL